MAIVNMYRPKQYLSHFMVETTKRYNVTCISLVGTVGCWEVNWYKVITVIVFVVCDSTCIEKGG